MGRLWPWLQTRLHASRSTIWTPRGAPMHSVQSRGVGIAKVRRSAAPLLNPFPNSLPIRPYNRPLTCPVDTRPDDSPQHGVRFVA